MRCSCSTLHWFLAAIGPFRMDMNLDSFCHSYNGSNFLLIWRFYFLFMIEETRPDDETVLEPPNVPEVNNLAADPLADDGDLTQDPNNFTGRHF